MKKQILMFDTDDADTPTIITTSKPQTTPNSKQREILEEARRQTLEELGLLELLGSTQDEKTNN